MHKSLFVRSYSALTDKLIEIRKRAGLSQRALAKRIGWYMSVIQRVERGQYRLDGFQLFCFIRGCGADPAKVMAEIMDKFQKAEEVGTKRRRKVKSR